MPSTPKTSVPVQQPATARARKAAPAGAKNKPLSPRGRGSVASASVIDEHRLNTLFAANVRLVRSSKGLSQEALADLCDLDRTYISGIERKIRNVSLKNIQRIADALGVDVRVLFDPGLTELAAMALWSRPAEPSDQTGTTTVPSQ